MRSPFDDVGRSLVNRLSQLVEAQLEGKGLALSDLASQLGLHIDSLVGHADPDWIEELTSAWWPLDLVNALSLDSGRESLSEEDQREVTEALDRLRIILTEY